MELDASLSWLALALTPGLGSRLSARVLRKFGSPDGVFRASLADLDGDGLMDILDKPYNWEAPRVDVWLQRR